MRIEQLFSPDQLWAVNPCLLESLSDMLQGTSSFEFEPVTSKQEAEQKLSYLSTLNIEHHESSIALGRVGNVAVLPIQGVIRPRPSFSFFSFGNASTNLLQATSDLRTALADDTIDTILLDVDSPGGMVTGTSEFAELVAAAAKQKRVVGYAMGTAASGAYWIISHCSEVIAADTADLGSIGVQIALIDTSKLEEEIGIRRILVRSSQSPLKNADPGTKEGADALQRRIDATADVFINAVARARKVTRDTVLTQFGQGDLLVGEQAQAAGLADRIGTFHEVLQTLVSNDTSTGGYPMQNDPKTAAFVPNAMYVADGKGQLSTAPINLTAEVVKELAPQVFESIAKSGADEAREEGRKEGAAETCERLKALEAAFTDPAERAVLDTVKYEPDANEAAVKVKLFDMAKENGGILPNPDLDEDETPGALGPDADRKNANGKTDQTAEEKAVEAADDAMLEELNAGR